MLVLADVEHGYVKSTLGTVGALALTCKYISLTPESNYTTSSLPSSLKRPQAAGIPTASAATSCSPGLSS